MASAPKTSVMPANKLPSHIYDFLEDLGKTDLIQFFSVKEVAERYLDNPGLPDIEECDLKALKDFQYLLGKANNLPPAKRHLQVDNAVLTIVAETTYHFWGKVFEHVLEKTKPTKR